MISNEAPLCLRSESERLRAKDGRRIFPTPCALKTVETLRALRERQREKKERKRTHIILRGRNDEDDDVMLLLPRFFAEEEEENPVVRSRFARGEMKDFIQLKVFQSAFAIQRNARILSSRECVVSLRRASAVRKRRDAKRQRPNVKTSDGSRLVRASPGNGNRSKISPTPRSCS